MSMATLSISFQESQRSAWGRLSRPASRHGGRTSSLPDALPRSQKNPAEAVSCISELNSFISEAGLHRRTTLPKVIFDLYAPPVAAAEKEGGAGSNEETMAHRRGRVFTKKKKLPKSPVAKKTNEVPKDEIDISSEGTADTQLIESATYPGYSPHSPTLLPHGLDAHEQMKRVTSAQIKLATKLETYRRAWCKLFYSPASKAVFLDYYWWFFLHKYQTKQDVIQDLLFTRIAKNYVKLICEPADLNTKDSFFKMYADLIAQCVYTTVMYAYPNSWISFDGDFKSELCLYITLWQVGTKPLPSSWMKWELRLLEPIDLPKCKTNEDDEFVKMVGSFDFDTLLKDARQRAAAEIYRSKLKARRSHQSQQMFDKKYSVTEVKNAMSRSHSKCHGKRAAARHSSTGIRTPTPDDDRLGVALEQLAALEQTTTSKVHLLVPAESQSPQPTTPATPKPLTASPQGQEMRESSSKDGSTPTRRCTGLSAPSRQLHASFAAEDDSGLKPIVDNTKRASSEQSVTFPATNLDWSSPKPCRKGSALKHSADGRKGDHESSPKSPGKASSRRLSSAGTTRSPIPRAEPTEAKLQLIAEGRRVSSSQPSGRSSPRPARRGSPWPRRKTSLPGDSRPVSALSHASKQTELGEQSSRQARKISSQRTYASSQASTSAVGAPLVPISQGTKYTGMLKRTTPSYKKREVSATLRGPEFEHVVFNLYGHSPLVKHYMQLMRLSHVNEKEIVVGRTEIAEEPSPDAVCYKDVLIESKAVTESNREQFLRHYRQQQQAMLSANRKRLAAKKLHEHNVKLMLAHQRDAQRLSDDLTHSDLKSKIESKSAAVTKVIQKSRQPPTQPHC